jgi:hypothetical protein
MAADAEGPVLLIKKLGGLLSIILGCLLTASGVAFESTGVTVVGVLLLALGAILLTLKIMRRNRSNQPGY